MGIKKDAESRGVLEFQSLLWQIGDQIGSEIVLSSKLNEMSEKQVRGFLHDIQSPLTVLNLLEPKIRKMDGEVASLITSALGQIKKLSKRLHMSSSKSETSMASNEGGQCHFPLIELYDCFNYLILSKSLEYKERVLFLRNLLPEAFDLSLPGEVEEWEAIFSNLINNSVENSSGICHIGLEVQIVDKGVRFKVWDAGPGLSEDQLQSFNSGVTWSQKGSERGMGLKQAINYLKAIGGQIHFSNQTPKGLLVEINVPHAR